jgi:hypothetical protein
MYFNTRNGSLCIEACHLLLCAAALGDMTGSTLPTSFLPVSYAPGSPFYRYVETAPVYTQTAVLVALPDC